MKPAAKVNKDNIGAMICLADMPLIKTSTYNQIIHSYYKNNRKFRGPQRRSYDSKTASTTPQSKNYNKKKQQQQQHKQQRRRQQKTINTTKLSKQCKISLNQIEDRLRDDYSLPIDERPML